MTRFKLVSAIISTALFIAVVPVTSGAAAKPTRWFQPIMQLPRSAIQTFRCVIYHESRSTFTHPNLGDNNRWGASGIFQIEQGTWQPWAALVGLHMAVWRASPYQQALGAVSIYRHDGFERWSADWMCF